jgi:hypothetical protein
MKEHTLSFIRAHELLAYDPTTGEFTWKESRGKSKAGKAVGTVQAGYRKTTLDNEQIRVHRLAWFMSYGWWPQGQIDHINGDKLDNRLCNLRDVPQSINMQNRYSTKTKISGLPYGVALAYGGRFTANIRIGVFDTPEEASAAFMRAKKLIHEGCTR